MEQAAQMYNDYYEGEVDVKPSDIRWRDIPCNEDGEVIKGLIASQFSESPFPIILLKTSDNKVTDLLITSTNLISGFQPWDIDSDATVDEFMQEQTLSQNGFLLIGWVTADSSLIGVGKQS